ncbi:MAG TPA: response regulator, partial [Nitrososphaeraceae archaeon]
KVGLEVYYYYHDDERRRRFEVYSYNDPEVALSKFKPNFYDLLLTDIYMPRMNGFELSQRVVEIDANIRVCFMSSAEVNIEALREVYPKISFGCFIKKPVTIDSSSFSILNCFLSSIAISRNSLVSLNSSLSFS